MMTRRMVGDVMTTDVVSVREDATFREIVDLLEGRDISAVPVVDWANLVVGVVSEADLLSKMEYAGDGIRRRLFEGHRIRDAREKAAGDLAQDLMTKPAVTVMPETTVVGAARLMDSVGVKQVRWFRPGSGWFTPRIRRMAGEQGLRVVLGTVVATHAGGTGDGQITAKLLREIRSGSIVVLHEGTVERCGVVGTTDELLARLGRRGFTAVTVSELVALCR
jgi:CBS domain-containing protein